MAVTPPPTTSERKRQLLWGAAIVVVLGLIVGYAVRDYRYHQLMKEAIKMFGPGVETRLCLEALDETALVMETYNAVHGQYPPTGTVTLQNPAFKDVVAAWAAKGTPLVDPSAPTEPLRYTVSDSKDGTSYTIYCPGAHDPRTLTFARGTHYHHIARISSGSFIAVAP